MALMMRMMTLWAIKRVWGSKDELLPERRLLPQLAAPAVLYGHITSQMMTVLLLIIMMMMLTIHKTAHDDHGEVVWPYYMMNISEYIQICPVSLKIYPNLAKYSDHPRLRWRSGSRTGEWSGGTAKSENCWLRWEDGPALLCSLIYLI